jgi:hypothetical protein
MGEPSMTTAKRRFTATFSDGRTITRKTDRNYTHAWRVHYAGFNGLAEAIGFSGSRLLAERALASWTNPTVTAREIADVVAS